MEFIDFLIQNSGKLEIHLPIIVFIETLIWYKFRGLKLEDFNSELKELGAHIDLLDEKIGEKISDVVVSKNKTLPFKIHARDYFIGAISDYNETLLITHNIRHFDWLQKKALTPEEFVKSFLSLK